MRLSKDEIEVLKASLKKLSTEARLYLFGSRADDSKRGGDIDLLVLSEKLKPKDLRNLRLDFFKNFGEQKMDILLDDGKLSTPFSQIAFKGAVAL
ncbi:MAG TPA: nucleotidyltransferase domain-containing protein [Campylobacterales bacterium]|nr:nucleotidyltransferase domain-containing protein [Campylobacterales bacterium]